MYNPFKPEKPAAAPAGPLTLATVGTVSEEGVTLILPGASEPTQAHYPNFSSSSLESGDSVIISRVSGTWVVMGKSGGGGGGGGGGTSNYNDLSNKPSINGNTLRGNKTASDLGLRTAAAQDAIDAAQDAEIGIVITGKRPSMAVTVGQYVIVRGSTISGIQDGLYTANAALSPSTDVTAADLTAVSDGGLNNLIGRMPLFRTHSVGSEPIVAGETRTITYTIPSIAGYTPHVTSVHIPDTSNINYAKVFMVWHQSGTTLSAHVFNTSSAQVAPSPRVECLYLPT